MYMHVGHMYNTCTTLMCMHAISWSEPSCIACGRYRLVSSNHWNSNIYLHYEHKLLGRYVCLSCKQWIELQKFMLIRQSVQLVVFCWGRYRVTLVISRYSGMCGYTLIRLLHVMPLETRPTCTCMYSRKQTIATVKLV